MGDDADLLHPIMRRFLRDVVVMKRDPEWRKQQDIQKEMQRIDSNFLNTDSGWTFDLSTDRQWSRVLNTNNCWIPDHDNNNDDLPVLEEVD